MAIILADRVKETTNTTGTGTLTLAGAATGFQSFAAIGDGNQTYYTIVSGSDWEIGLGTYTASGTTLSRDTIYSSSNSGAAITVSAGAEVFVTYPSDRAITDKHMHTQQVFSGTSPDGLVIDYSHPYARFSVQSSDGFKFYSGGVAATQLGMIDSTGNWTANGMFTAGTGTTIGGATNPVIVGASASSTYVQSYLVNNTNGTASSADFVCYPHNGTDTSGWADMGFTSASFADPTYTVTGGNEGYIFSSAPSGASTSGSLVLATDSTGTNNNIEFYVGGFSQGKTTPLLMLKDSTNNIGIRTAAPTAALHLPAGTASASTAPLKMTSGTNLTTAEAGAVEFDGKVFYGSAESSQRGIILAPQIQILTSNYTTATGTASTLKQTFNASTNGAITVAGSMTYEFECLLNLSSLSATSGSVGFGLAGTATYSRVQYIAIANKTALAVQTASSHTFGTSAAYTIVTAANTTATAYVYVKGIVVIGAGGTIIPSSGASIAAAYVVNAGSYFKLTPLGSNTLTTVGNWS